MQSVYTEKEACCGCGTCSDICALDAITMQPDEEGFLYPVIDPSLCADCGRCTEICPILRKGHYKEASFPHFYAARHKSKDVLLHSTSGGAFTALSDAILHQGGVVYGAVFDEAFRVLHARAETPAQRDRMRFSKYVQSNLRDTFSRIQSDLRDGRKVLFTGTPCQNAGLRGFLGDSPLAETLYCCDVICYGIASPLIWEDYKRHLEQEYGGALVTLQFRSKKYAWSRPNSKKGFLLTTQGSPEPQEDNRFYQLFFQAGTINRPSCSQCPFTDIYRPSDITIADYWGIEKYSSSWFSPLGVSLVLVNSEKGSRLFQQLGEDLETEERSFEEAFREQKKLSRPAPLPENRVQFWQDYRQLGFDRIFDQYTVNDPSSPIA